jgi:predicted RNA-binding protein YlxR (DUF448 family)
MTETTQLSRPGVVGVGHNSQAELAERIKYAYSNLLRSNAKDLVDRVVKFGQLLLDEKAKFGGRGEWLEWVEENSGVKKRTAQRAMRLAENKTKLDDEVRKLTPEDQEKMSLNKALSLIKSESKSNPKPPPNASDKYDSASKTLIIRLKDLTTPDDAVAAATKTIQALQETVVAMRGWPKT